MFIYATQSAFEINCCLLVDANDELEIAGLAVDVRLALRVEAVLVAVAHARLDLELEQLLLVHVLDIRTVVAHLLLRHLKATRSDLHGAHLGAAVALARARGRLHHRLVAHDLHEVARVHLLERDVQVHDDGAASGSLLLAFVAATEAAEASEAAKVTETAKVAEKADNNTTHQSITNGFTCFVRQTTTTTIFSSPGKRILATAAIGALLDALLARLVVYFPLVGVAEHLVGGRQVLELLLRLRIFLVLVRMELFGELAIRLLDLVEVSIALYAQYLVEVASIQQQQTSLKKVLICNCYHGETSCQLAYPACKTSTRQKRTTRHTARRSCVLILTATTQRAAVTAAATHEQSRDGWCE